MSKLDLRGVTLCAIDHAAHDLTRYALLRCLDACDFADVLILSDREILHGARHIKTSVNDKSDAELLLNLVLPQHVETNHYLYVQWDSWIMNPDVWYDDLLQYDYIGAPWPDNVLWNGCNPAYNVGNGGFSLRSVALANAMRSMPLYSPEDHAICVANRLALEALGFKWPTTDVAYRFAAELQWPEALPFGFHGAFNLAAVLTPDEYAEVKRLASPYVRQTKAWQALQRNLTMIRNGLPKPDWHGPLKPGWQQ